MTPFSTYIANEIFYMKYDPSLENEIEETIKRHLDERKTQEAESEEYRRYLKRKNDSEHDEYERQNAKRSKNDEETMETLAQYFLHGGKD